MRGSLAQALQGPQGRGRGAVPDKVKWVYSRPFFVDKFTRGDGETISGEDVAARLNALEEENAQLRVQVAHWREQTRALADSRIEDARNCNATQEGQP